MTCTVKLGIGRACAYVALVTALAIVATGCGHDLDFLDTVCFERFECTRVSQTPSGPVCVAWRQVDPICEMRGSARDGGSEERP